MALFHVTRIVLILPTLPLLPRLLLPLPPSDQGAGSSPHGTGRPIGVAKLAAAADRRPQALRLLAITGALIFGTTLGAALVTAAFRSTARTPQFVRTGAQVGLGCMIGTLITPETLVVLGRATVPAVLAAVLVVTSGVAVAFLQRWMGYAPPGDVLATSPGALEAVSSAAIDRDEGVV